MRIISLFEIFVYIIIDGITDLILNLQLDADRVPKIELGIHSKRRGRKIIKGTNYLRTETILPRYSNSIINHIISQKRQGNIRYFSHQG